MSQRNLEARLQYLESCEAIRSLVGRYATAADQRNNPQILQHLFHDDAVWAANGFGEYQGRQNILAALSSIAEAQILSSLHIMAIPDIKLIDDQHATAGWMLWEVCNFAANNQPASTHCLGGFYQSVIRRDEDGTWKFERVDLNLTFNQPYPAA
ncbi:nuclear transport factor 2 family protein [Acinetobacter terrestris]|uniref:Nuclear transport factor 2 family protein n=1 Tax=Acinetobacter terrestris TaxID=2529843 RepID=A0ABX1UTS7_9GAMM|nr:nuclear transport factor 2 family protein [Acinetobacter terrestris]NNH26623.1 nuclear transport factor 2 family protein [Acinetobacter terrestris]